MYMHVLYGAAETRKGRLRSFRDDDDDDDDDDKPSTLVVVLWSS